MRILLIAQRDDEPTRRTWLVPGQSLTVGRTDHADFSFSDDLRMSSVHFVISYDSSGCRFDDLNSTNGTYLNEKLISNGCLQPGDLIRAGMTKFAIERVTDRLSRADTAPQPTERANETCIERGIKSADLSVLASMRLSTEGPSRANDFSSSDSIKKRSNRDHQLQSEPRPKCARPPKIPCSQAAQEAAATRIPAGICLELQSEADGRKAWLLPGQQLTVGRTASSDFAVSADATLSSRHFAVRCEPEAIFISDLRSTNGTLVNGNPVSSARIFDGDVIQAGAMRFLVHGTRAQGVSNYGKSGKSNGCRPPNGISKTTLESGLVIYRGDRKHVAIRDIVDQLTDRFHPYLIQEPALEMRIANPVYLYDWIPPRCAAQMSPVFIADRCHDTLLDWLNASWETDSVSCLFSDLEASDLLPKLRLAARGQYRENVIPIQAFMLTDTRPSTLAKHLQQADSRFLQYLFGAVNAFLLPSDEDADWRVLSLDDQLFENGWSREAP